MAKSIEKEEVEIKGKVITEEGLKRVLEQLEVPVQPPPIEDTLEKANQAIKNATKVKKPIKQVWHCTECGSAHIQLYPDGNGHFNVDALDDEFVDHSGNPLTGREAKAMETYAVPRAKSGAGGNAVQANRSVLSKMEQIKAKKGGSQ